MASRIAVVGSKPELDTTAITGCTRTLAVILALGALACLTTAAVQYARNTGTAPLGGREFRQWLLWVGAASATAGFFAYGTGNWCDWETQRLLKEGVGIEGENMNRHNFAALTIGVAALLALFGYAFLSAGIARRADRATARTFCVVGAAHLFPAFVLITNCAARELGGRPAIASQSAGDRSPPNLD